jgi:hypothetical protein
MNEIPPNQDQADEVDDLYRRESALDPSRPSESVRRAVLEHATQLASARSAKNGPAQSGAARPAANPRWWRPTAFGTLAAAALAGLLIIPRFLAPDAPPVGALPTAPVRPNAAATAASQAEVREQPPDAMAEVRPQSPPPAEESALKPRVFSRNGATVADSAAEIDAKNAPAKVQSMINARSTAAGGGSETDARRAQSGGATGISASPSQSIAPTAQSIGSPPQSAAPAVQSAAPAAAQSTAPTAQSAPSPPQSAMSPRQSPAPAAPPARLADSAAEVRRAAEIGAVPELQTLLGQQGDIDARDESGRTALMLATLHGQARAVDVLLAHGADPNAADAQGVTPLQAAIAGDRPAIAAALRRAGAR